MTSSQMSLQAIQNSFMSKRLADPKPLIMQQFELLREIGRGAFGIVYSARDKKDKYLIAAKRNTGTSDGPYWTENSVLRSIGHMEFFPGLIRTSLHNGDVYIAMTLEGANMIAIAEHSPDEKLSKRNLLLFIYHACRAVDALHGQNIVHRDIKPANFVTGRSSGKAPVVLLDFGYAQRFDGNVFQIPTINFLAVPQAPPQILRGGEFTTMADWFLLANGILDLAGYSKAHVSRNGYLKREEKADIHDARYTGLKFELSRPDQYLVPIIEKFYTPGIDVFDLQSVLSLVMAEEGFNPAEPFLVEESTEES